MTIWLIILSDLFQFQRVGKNPDRYGKNPGEIVWRILDFLFGCRKIYLPKLKMKIKLRPRLLQDSVPDCNIEPVDSYPYYKLLSLEEIKYYIEKHKHLPEVPSPKKWKPMV